MNYNHQLIKAEKKAFSERHNLRKNHTVEDYSSIVFFAYIVLVVLLVYVIL